MNVFRAMRPVIKMSGAFAVCLTLTALPGCGEPPGTGGPETITSPGSVTQVERLFENSFEKLYDSKLDAAVASTPVKGVLQDTASWPALKWRPWLREFYRSRNFQPIVTENGVPGHVATAFLEHASHANAHALSPRKYLRLSIGRYARLANEASVACQQLTIPALNAQTREVVQRALKSAEDDEPSDATSYVWYKLMSDEQASALQQTFNKQKRLRQVCAGFSAALEAVLADAMIDYIYDNKGFNWLRINPEAEPEEQHKIVKAETLRIFETLVHAKNAEEATEILDSLFPDKEQYRRLKRALVRYRGYVEEGGFGAQIERKHLQRGSQNDTVRLLKKRLAAEDFYSGPIDKSFGEELEKAVKDYQYTHQMETTGKTSKGFWASINTSASDRLAQIKLTMQRWRESRTIGAKSYVHINIPDFHAELWLDGKRERRFRIVVGNTLRECRDEELQYVNATPVQSAEMTYVVLNPYWNVPHRIVQDELLPQLAKDPTYFEEHGYESEILDNGYQLVRQKPGRGNALGRVKFMFPNEHNTYMHDTPKKGYFNYSVRAFSHGCMRVQNPMGFLEAILRSQGLWDPSQIARIQEHGKERRITLEEALPVHSEYFVVRVDDKGGVHFNADIYRLDRARLDPGYVRIKSCTPPSEPEEEYVLTEKGSVMVRDEQGNLMAPQDALAEKEGDTELNPNAEIALPMDFGP